MTEGFVFDQQRCTGCSACRLGCTIENDLPPASSWRRVRTANPQRDPGFATVHLSSACHHCEDAACLRACPTLAITRAADGTVALDDARCIGCRYCSWACPYDAPVYDQARGVMTKCTGCPSRLAAGRPPACISSCPTGALEWGALDRGRLPGPAAAAALLRPRLRMVPPVDGAALFGAAANGAGTVAGGDNSPQVGLREEWPLALFSLAACVLTAWAAAAAWLGESLRPLPFLTVAVLATALSTHHLGAPRRAWRAAVNVRRSWLSREIAAWALFVAFGTAAAFGAGAGRLLPVFAAVAGAVTLLCIDAVYRVLERAGPRGPHSGGALVTGLFLFALMARLPELLVTLAALRALSFAHRLGVTWLLARLVFLFVGAGIAVAWPARAVDCALPIALVGEAIDRGLYYTELRRFRLHT